MDIVEKVNRSLDGIRRTSDTGVEYWMARDLQVPLGYSRWEKFESVIEKGIMACESSGTDPKNHFHPKVKMIIIGKGAKRKQKDYYLSRYAAYLIAMNGNPRLLEIATAQTYFAVQTRKQEIAERGYDLNKRIELRERVKTANKHLNDAASESGVQNYALFHAAGYKGLYGIYPKAIKVRKGIDRKEEILDRAGRAELAANEFRITQTEEALTKSQITGDISAQRIHETIGKEVRNTIEKIGGTMPEDLPAEPSIKKMIADKNKKGGLIEQKLIEDKEENKKA